MSDKPSISNTVKEAALDAAANGIIISDRQGVIQWVNPAFTEMTGYTLEEAVGRKTNLLKSGRQNPTYYMDLWNTVSSGKVWRGDLINTRKDGSHYTEEMTITPVKDRSGEVTHYIAIKQDVTARRQAEEQLEQARATMKAVLDATGEAMILLAPDASILWMNRSFEQTFAVPHGMKQGQSFQDMLPQFEKAFKDPVNIKKRFEENTGNGYRETLQQQWPQPRMLELYAEPVKHGAGDQKGRLYVFRDVTREREVERMKTDFIHLVSHEFRTPLSSIKGYVEMLLDGDAGELQGEQREFLETVQRNTDLLALLVNDLLEVSRLEAGALKLNTRQVDVAQVISEVTGKLRPQFIERSQKLNISVAAELPTVQADQAKLAQILLNLLSNAHKYTPDGGMIHVSAQREQGAVRVTVTDTGVGISPEDQKRLFTKFFRVEDPDIQKEAGTGLGLWITRRLVEMHGGTITAESRLGQGTTMTFTLPDGK